jgi:hypothetical protein
MSDTVLKHNEKAQSGWNSPAGLNQQNTPINSDAIELDVQLVSAMSD